VVSGSDGQGFGKPQGYKGKGKEGKGQGTDFETPSKPLPLVKGQGFLVKGQGFQKYYYSVITVLWVLFIHKK
jgi:hypothetical protein